MILLDPVAPRDIGSRVRPVSFLLQNLDASIQRLASAEQPLVLALQAVDPRAQCEDSTRHTLVDEPVQVGQ